MLFALELDRRVRAAGIPVRSLLAHPGWSATNLQSSGPTGIMKELMKLGNRLFAQSAYMGALGELYAAVDPAAESGCFYGPGGLGGLRGYPTLVQAKESARDQDTARHLWKVSEELTGVTFAL